MTSSSGLCLSAAALLLGCHSPVDTRVGLAVAASIRPEPAVVGQTLSIEVTVANSYATEYFVSGSSSGCFAIVDVRDSYGGLVPNANRRACDLASVQHPIAPSTTLVDRLSFAGLAAGTYRVRARVGVVAYGEVQSPD